MNLFFDLDGPILDVSSRYYEVYSNILIRLKHTPLQKNEYWDLKRSKVSDYDILLRTSSEFSFEEFKVQRSLTIEKEEFLELDCVWPELLETYKALFAKFPATLITLRTNPRITEWQLHSLGIHPWFDTVLSCKTSNTSDARWKAKSQALVKSEMLKKVNVQDCVFVGDTETDILAGQNLGMKTIGVSFGIRTKPLLSQLNPDFIFETPGQLSNYLQFL